MVEYIAFERTPTLEELADMRTAHELHTAMWALQYNLEVAKLREDTRMNDYYMRQRHNEEQLEDDPSGGDYPRPE